MYEDYAVYGHILLLPAAPITAPKLKQVKPSEAIVDAYGPESRTITNMKLG